jgi:hypothetical protein
MLLSDLSDNRTDFFICKIEILAPLKDKGAKSQQISLVAAVQNLLFGKPVSLRLLVGSANPAVEAVISAIVGKLDQTAKKNLFSIVLVPHFGRFPVQIGCLFLGHRRQQSPHLLSGKGLFFTKPVDPTVVLSISFHITNLP